MRAVGRIVVWVDADADVRMDAASSSSRMCPITESPNSAGPIAENTSLEFASAPRPMPSVPTPANATAATVTTP